MLCFGCAFSPVPFRKSDPHRKLQALRCTICSHQSLFGDVMVQHSLDVHFLSNDQTASSTLVDSTSFGEPVGTCNKCEGEKQFTLSAFLSHFFQQHCANDPTGKIWNCAMCARVCKSKNVLKLHKETVHTERKFVCEQCGDCFKLPHQLRQHLVKHSQDEELLLQCDVCGKEFKRRHTLRAHIMTHLEKEFKCDFCGKEFLYGWAHRKHLREKHNSKTQETLTKLSM